MKRRGYGIAGSGNRTIAKGPEDYFRSWDWNARCDECYLKCKANDMFYRWDNARVCYRCIELRNPQDFVHGIPDHPSPPWTRPTPPPQFVAGNGTSAAPPQPHGKSELTGAELTGSQLTG